jgi:ABC-type glycerol-3-phosphate transport system substrate-binding protein
MGHCGRADQGMLYSLRSGEKRRSIKPMVTLEFADGVVYQVKGKANKAPTEDLWPYIDWFLENAGVEKFDEDGTHSSDSVGFIEMLEYLKQKHPDIKFEDSWITEANELLEQYAPGFESDSQTSQEVDWPSMGSLAVSFLVKHQAFWPVKDIIVQEETTRLRYEIRQDAQRIGYDTLSPNPNIVSVDVFPRGVQDSQAAMLRIEMEWVDSFEPDDPDEPEDVAEELARLNNYLD